MSPCGSRVEVGEEPRAPERQKMSVEWGGPGHSSLKHFLTSENLLENLSGILGLVLLQLPMHVFAKA